MNYGDLWMRETERDSRSSYQRWLLLADEPLALATYWDQGVLWVFGVGQETVATALMVSHQENRVVEIKNLAVAPLWQGRGIGNHVIRLLITHYRSRDYQEMAVGTANCSLGNLAFYQKAGFRMDSIRKDFFTPVHGYTGILKENGIVMQDMVWMTQDLQERRRG